MSLLIIVVYSNNDITTLQPRVKSNTFTYGDIQHHYGPNGVFNVKFIIKVVDADALPISDVSEIKLDSRRKFINVARYSEA